MAALCVGSQVGLIEHEPGNGRITQLPTGDLPHEDLVPHSRDRQPEESSHPFHVQQVRHFILRSELCLLGIRAQVVVPPGLSRKVSWFSPGGLQHPPLHVHQSGTCVFLNLLEIQGSGILKSPFFDFGPQAVLGHFEVKLGLNLSIELPRNGSQVMNEPLQSSVKACVIHVSRHQGSVDLMCSDQIKLKLIQFPLWTQYRREMGVSMR